MTMVQYERVLPEREAKDAQASLAAAGGAGLQPPRPYKPGPDELDDYGDSQFEPLMIVTAALAAGVLIKLISKAFVDYRYPGGELFDLRGGKLVQRRVPSLPQGTLVLVTDAGTQRFAPAARDEGLAALNAALSTLSAPGA